MEKDLEEVTCASLGYAAFVAKRRKSPGLDLRIAEHSSILVPNGDA